MDDHQPNNQQAPTNQPRNIAGVAFLNAVTTAATIGAVSGAGAAIGAAAAAKWDLGSLAVNVAKLGATVGAITTAIHGSYNPEILTDPKELSSYLAKMNLTVGCMIGIINRRGFDPLILGAGLFGGYVGEKAAILGGNAAAMTLARFTQNAGNNRDQANGHDTDPNHTEQAATTLVRQRRRPQNAAGVGARM